MINDPLLSLSTQLTARARNEITILRDSVGNIIDDIPKNRDVVNWNDCTECLYGLVFGHAVRGSALKFKKDFNIAGTPEYEKFIKEEMLTIETVRERYLESTNMGALELIMDGSHWLFPKGFIGADPIVSALMDDLFPNIETEIQHNYYGYLTYFKR